MKSKTEPLITIRPMRRKDLGAVVSMIGKLNRYHGDTGNQNAAFLLQHCFGVKCPVHVWLAISDKEIVGFVLTRDWANFVRAHIDCSLDLLFVEDKWRNKRVGHLLSAHAAAAAMKRGCKRLLTTSAPTNVKAKHFYFDLGFTLRPIKPNSYLMKGKALLRLAKI